MASGAKKTKKKSGRMRRLKEKLFPCTKKKKPVINKPSTSDTTTMTVDDNNELDNEIDSSSVANESLSESESETTESVSQTTSISPSTSVESLNDLEINFSKSSNLSNSVLAIPPKRANLQNCEIQRKECLNHQIYDSVKIRNSGVVCVGIIEIRDQYGILRESREMNIEDIKSYNNSVCLAKSGIYI
jgi:hypothetical protein